MRPQKVLGEMETVRIIQTSANMRKIADSSRKRTSIAIERTLDHTESSSAHERWEVSTRRTSITLAIPQVIQTLVKFDLDLERILLLFHPLLSLCAFLSIILIKWG